MSLKNLSLNVEKSGRPTDPLKIFKGLTLRGSVENIWGPQESALRDWDKHREAVDNVIRMNTGGGKTLVGLLIAQSLVNETTGHVLYVCSTNQLVEQTIEKAVESGMCVSHRYQGQWDEEACFDSGEMFCVTNYAAFFNGFSVFRDKGVDAVVFDDAHVAEQIIRSQFTIEIRNDSPLFKRMLGVYRPYYANSCQSSQFDDASSGSWDSLVYVPMFVVSRHTQQVRKMLLEAGIAQDSSNKYPWEHLKNKLDICCCVISGRGIHITPSVLPLHVVPHFKADMRKVYLTATMPTRVGFVRTFGVSNPNVITPEGKSGDAQRLFIFSHGDDDEETREHVLELVDGKKSCVICPSNRSAEDWSPPAKLYDKESGHAGIQEFADSDDAEMLALVARYDGVDLPGDACRVLILDRLPEGENLFDRFIDQSIQINTIRSSHTAVRLVQAIGRIFRSNTDHGVVILRALRLQSWLRTPRNRGLLPELLQKQIQFGKDLREAVEREEMDYSELMNGVLCGDRSWDRLYRETIDQYPTEAATDEADWCHELLVDERDAYFSLWNGQYGQAAGRFAVLATAAAKNEERLQAWYLHWAGLAWYLEGDAEKALSSYQGAANIRAELGRPYSDKKQGIATGETINPSFQANAISQRWKDRRKAVGQNMEKVESGLVYGDKTNPAEKAVKHLGLLLGLNASRPDSEGRSGPDALWIGEGAIKGVAFELKTNKASDGEYSKEDVKDCNDHTQWLATEYPDEVFVSYIVGHELPVAGIANPSNDLGIVTVEAMEELASRMTQLYEQVELSGDSSPEEFEKWLRHFGLRWPQCVNSLPFRLAVDKQDMDEETA